MGASLLVFSNKTDVGGCMSDDEIRAVFPSLLLSGLRTLTPSKELHLDAIKTHRWTVIGCSAITGRNLETGLEWVVQDARDRLFLY